MHQDVRFFRKHSGSHFKKKKNRNYRINWKLNTDFFNIHANDGLVTLPGDDTVFTLDVKDV